MRCVRGCAQERTSSAWQTLLQLGGLMYSCEEGRATLGGVFFQIRGIGHFPSFPRREEVSRTSHLFQYELQKFPKDRDLVELVLGIFCQSFSWAFRGSLFVPAAQHHAPIPVPRQQWEPGSQTSPGADAKAGNRNHPPSLPCLCSA